jgi:hypothetical protein
MIFLLSGACLPSVKGLETRQTSLFADFYTKKDTGKRTSALDKSQQKKSSTNSSSWQTIRSMALAGDDAVMAGGLY